MSTNNRNRNKNTKKSSNNKKPASTYSTDRCLSSLPPSSSTQQPVLSISTQNQSDERVSINGSRVSMSNSRTPILQDLMTPSEEQSLPDVVEACRLSNYDATSAITSVDLVEHSVIRSFTKYNVFPKLKFLIKVSDDPRMQWSTDRDSLCQYVLHGCNIAFDSKTPLEHQQQQWFSVRKIVAEKITSLRNDKSSAIRIAFFGKFVHLLFFKNIF